jgi:hypothetical protein
LADLPPRLRAGAMVSKIVRNKRCTRGQESLFVVVTPVVSNFADQNRNGFLPSSISRQRTNPVIPQPALYS